MKYIHLDAVQIEKDFALEAAKHFSTHPEHYTYTSKDIVAGCLFALKGGLSKDCVVVLKLDEEHEPTNYCQIIESKV